MNHRKSFWMLSILASALVLSACNLGATPLPAVDPAAIQTQAFNEVLTQVASGQTQTAQAAPPTALPTGTAMPTATLGGFPTFAPAGGIGTITPFAFNTAQPGFTPITTALPTLGVVATITTKNGCNDGTYLGETKPYDKSVVKGGTDFSKAWTILNTGTCTWDEGYRFEYLADSSSPELKGYTIVLPKNKPSDYTKPGFSQSFVVHLHAPGTPGEYKAYWKLRDDSGNYFGPLVSVWIVIEKK
jgi:hypothetical protein